MAIDSSVRLKQINQSELSGFVSGIVSLFQQNLSGNLSSTGSGIFNLGSSSDPYNQIFANQLNVTGINFSGTPFNAYLSGGYAVINVGGVTITSEFDAVYIQGPSGAIGPSGALGPSGASGISVTGISYDTNSYVLSFNLSNNTTKTFNFEGLSGSTGISLTGFLQSGTSIYPQFSNFTLGQGIPLIAGPAGSPGSISLFFQQDGSNSFYPVTNFPTGVIINPYYYSSPNPAISLMRGMSYTLSSSGLDTHAITTSDLLFLSRSGLFSGQTLPFVVGSLTNYFEQPGGGTGYWRPVFFPNGTATGFITTATSPSLFSETSNTQVYGNTLANNLYRTEISFTADFTAQNEYQYGFMVYTLGGEDTTTDTILTSPTGYAYVLGNVYFSSGIGPVGPTGAPGIQGIQGNQGNIGPQGSQGQQGLSVSSYNQQQIGLNSYQIQFVFSDGSIGPWISLPSGGPSGVNGAQGSVGSLANYFSGVYSNSVTYITNSVVTENGSSYINTGNSSVGVSPPVSPWQLLAQSGQAGPSGSSGYADHYNANFSVISGLPSITGVYGFNITGISVNGINLSGSNSKFTTGQIVSFVNSGLIGYAYTPYQSIIVSTNTNTGSYFYATINSYISQSGIINFTVNTGIPNITGLLNITVDSSNNVLWSGYGNATINLGANIVSGAIGPIGPVGIQGPPGAISVMRNGCYIGSYNPTGWNIYLEPTGLNITGGSGIDIFNILITGNGTQLYGNTPINIGFDWKYINTGQSIIVKVRNSGIPDGNSEPLLFNFNGSFTGDNNTINIKWPGGIYTCPSWNINTAGQAYIYTILRFPDEFGQFAGYGTYSNPY